MKKLLLISMVFGVLPLSMLAQDDDLYFVPSKKSVEKVVDDYGMPKGTYYTGSDRSVDEYNRRIGSVDSIKVVYPDSLGEDYTLTRHMTRFDEYELADNAAFWAGYRAGRDDYFWHSPWYFGRYGWYDTWAFNRYGWYDPWYYGYYFDWAWYDPWYYRYGWWDYGYRYRWYGPIFFVGGGYRTNPHIGTGTIRRDGSSHTYYNGRAVAGNSRRVESLRDRVRTMGGSNSASSGNNRRSRSGNFSGYRGNTTTSSSTYSGARSTGSFSGARSSGGSYSGGSSGGSFGGSRSSSGGGGGGGSRMGGKR